MSRLVVEDEGKRKRIISAIHDPNHLGVNRTLSMVTTKYYWPGITTDVKDYVRFFFVVVFNVF